MPYVKKARKVYRKKSIPRKVKRAVKPSKRLVKTIQSVINKNAENKCMFGSISNVYYNSGINSSADVTDVIPSLGIGANDNQRIGDQIRAMSHTIKGCLQLSAPNTNISNCRIMCRLMIVQPKAFGSFSAIGANATTWLAYLLKKGGVTTGFTGVLSDLWSPINSDAITTYYDKKFMMDTAFSQGTGNGLSTLGNSVKFFSHTFRGKNKLLKYDSGIDSGLLPSNYNPCIILGYVHLDGTAPDTVTTAIALSFDSIINYQDM